MGKANRQTSADIKSVDQHKKAMAALAPEEKAPSWEATVMAAHDRASDPRRVVDHR
jgi:hypothetical protein